MDGALWALIEPLLPPWPERSPGPRPVADRLCLQGILYVLYNDIAWQLLPLEMGFGSGQTCWRRLERWQQAGVFDAIGLVGTRDGNVIQISAGQTLKCPSGEEHWHGATSNTFMAHIAMATDVTESNPRARTERRLVPTIIAGPARRGLSEDRTSGLDRQPPDDMVAASAERGTDTKWHLLAKHQDPLLGPVLGDEPRTQHLVGPVDRAHGDRTDDARRRLTVHPCVPDRAAMGAPAHSSRPHQHS
ncbi:transposase [Streptomyces sp. NPDC004393]